MWQLAAMVLVLLGAYFFLNQQTHQLITPNGIHQQWTLPDGSGISLNGFQSRLRPEFLVQ